MAWWHLAYLPRRIDANRIVSYYDFDGRGNPLRKPAGSLETAEDEDTFFMAMFLNCFVMISFDRSF